MPSEALVQAIMKELDRFPREKRETLLVALAASRFAREEEGVDLVMDPQMAQLIQPILDDPIALEGAIEALNRLSKADAKKGGVFGRLFGRK